MPVPTQKMSKCGEDKKMTHEALDECVADVSEHVLTPCVSYGNSSN